MKVGPPARRDGVRRAGRRPTRAGAACRRAPGPCSGTGSAIASGCVSSARGVDRRCAPRSAARPPSAARRRTGWSRRPCLIALVSISWSTRNATTVELGRQRLRRADLAGERPRGRRPHAVDAGCPGRRAGPAAPRRRRSRSAPGARRRSEVRAEVAMFAIVCFRRRVSASSRYCADSAWARITASEWPTTSCTSRASRACSSRSWAISSAWSRSASAVDLRGARLLGPGREAQREARPATAPRAPPCQQHADA